MRKIYVYRNDAGEVPVLRFIESTHKKIRNKFDFMLHFVKDERNMLCEPYVKHFSIDKYKMLYELRIRANGDYGSGYILQGGRKHHFTSRFFQKKQTRYRKCA